MQSAVPILLVLRNEVVASAAAATAGFTEISIAVIVLVCLAFIILSCLLVGFSLSCKQRGAKVTNKSGRYRVPPLLSSPLFLGSPYFVAFVAVRASPTYVAHEARHRLVANDSGKKRSRSMLEERNFGGRLASSYCWKQLTVFCIFVCACLRAGSW